MPICCYLFKLRPINSYRFSSDVLTSLCRQTDGHPLAGMIVIGDGQSARAISLAGTAMKLPVLWAKGGKATLYGLNHEVKIMETL